MAFNSQNIKFYFTTSTVVSTAIRVTDIRSVGGPSGSGSIIDVSNLDSTMREKVMGLGDEGQLTIQCHMVASDSGQTKMRECRANKTKSGFRILLPDTSSNVISGECYVTGMSMSAGVDNAITCDYTLEITGPTSWTTA